MNSNSQFVQAPLVAMVLLANACTSARVPPEEHPQSSPRPDRAFLDVSREECSFGELSADAEPIDIQELSCEPRRHIGRRVRVRGHVITMYDMQSVVSADRMYAVAASWDPALVLRRCSGRILDIEGFTEESGAKGRVVLRIISVRDVNGSEVQGQREPTLQGGADAGTGADGS